MGVRGALREYASVWEALLRGGDAVVVAFSGWVAALVYLGALPNLPGYDLGLVLAVLLTLVMFPLFGLYRPWRGSSLRQEVQAVTLAWCVVLVGLTLLVFLTKRGPEFSRGWFLIWLGLGWGGLVLERALLRLLLRELRRRGHNQRRVVIVCSGRLGVGVASGLAAAPWAGLKTVALFHPAGGDCQCHAPGGGLDDSIQHFEVLDDLAGFVARDRIDQVWIALPLKEEAMIRQTLYLLRHTTADVRYVPDISTLRLLGHSLEDVAGFSVMTLSGTRMDGINRLVKAIEDRVLALFILVLISPLLLAIAIGVKLSSPGPVLFRQRRLGLGAEQITVLKFRSMKQHQDAPGKVTQAKKCDSRVTPFGAFLRRTSLDELPQFFNVLCGEMSIVGPRPHALEHNEQYKELVDKYMLRHKIKPGITGWAQINGYRGETDTLEKMQKRVEHDLHYIENWSLWLDLKIIALTVVRGFVDRNAY